MTTPDVNEQLVGADRGEEMKTTTAEDARREAKQEAWRSYADSLTGPSRSKLDFVSGFDAGVEYAAASRWRSIEKDGLPESGELVLCQTRQGQLVVQSWVAFCDQDAPWFANRFVAWMPLPALFTPEEETNDEM